MSERATATLAHGLKNVLRASYGGPKHPYGPPDGSLLTVFACCGCVQVKRDLAGRTLFGLVNNSGTDNMRDDDNVRDDVNMVDMVALRAYILITSVMLKLWTRFISFFKVIVTLIFVLT